MMKYISIILLFSVSFFGFAQTEIHELHFSELLIEDTNTVKSNFIEIFVFDHINSNSISNSLVNDFLFDGHLSEDAKQATYDLEKGKNRMGVYFDYGVMFKQRMKNGLIYSVRYRDINYRSMGYDSNLLKLALSGNKQFDGQQIELNDLSFKERSIQDLSIGLEKFFDEKSLFFGGSISFLKTDYSRALAINDASFYTGVDGESVSFSADVSLKETDKIGTKLSRFEGMGASINLYALKNIDDKQVLEFAITDLGFISTLSSTALYEKDTTVSFQGVDLLNSSQSGSSIASGTGLNEVFDIEKQQKKYTYALPFFVRLNYKYYLDKKWTFFAGLHYRKDENYIPKLFIKPGYNFNKQRTRIAPLFSYGGFSNFDFGISLYQKVAGNFYMTADLLYLEMLLIPDNSTSQGFNLGVYSKF